MKLGKFLMIGASVSLLGACAAPNEYTTYDTNKTFKYIPASESKSDSNWGSNLKFWKSDKEVVMEKPVMQEPSSAPIDITNPAGRVN